ncbi:VanZ family protein [Microbacterium sp. P04]|uniref:VanZ family protein n=1 Tax=Microbacterium sp. P04 TaxID=3366947 RepID=UPI0037460D0E
MPTTTTRSIRTLAALMAVAAVAALTLAPRRIVAPARGGFMRLMDAVAQPLLAWMPSGEAERVLNTLMFLPLGAAIALLLSRRLWPLAVLAGFALSATVEYAQASIPGRVPDPNDVFYNTVGAAIGVVVVTLVRWLAAAVGRTTRQIQPRS